MGSRIERGSGQCDGFMEVDCETVDGFTLTKLLPVDRKPALVRVGMAVEFGGLGIGRVVEVSRDSCAAIFPDGEIERAKWGEVYLVDCAPDPAELGKVPTPSSN